MIVRNGSTRGEAIRQKYIPARDCWLFESPMKLTTEALAAAIANARKTMVDRLRSLPATAGVERRRRFEMAVRALDEGRVYDGFIAAPGVEKTAFKATTRERPDRTFFIPQGA